MADSQNQPPSVVIKKTHAGWALTIPTVVLAALAGAVIPVGRHEAKNAAETTVQTALDARDVMRADQINEIRLSLKEINDTLKSQDSKLRSIEQRQANLFGRLYPNSPQIDIDQ